MAGASWCLFCSVYLFLYGLFCHGALKLDISTLFLLASLQFIYYLSLENKTTMLMYFLVITVRYTEVEEYLSQT